MKFSLSLGLAGFLLSVPVVAQTIDKTWSVVGFEGEPWFVEPQALVSASQVFQDGFAEGPFFNCDFGGLSATYTRYTPDDFFANPEFETFALVEEDIRLSSSEVYVHRLSCGNSLQTLYPFVTNEAGVSAWLLFEGGVFILYAP